MNRRTFIASAVAVAAAGLFPATQQRRGMLHLFSNYEGELVAANTLDEAARYHDCELGGSAEPEEGWSQVPDGARVPICDWDDTGETETMTASEWAAQFDEPTQVATTYA